MAQTTFNFDDRTEELIQRLKGHFHAGTKAEIMRKALALLDLVRQAESEGREIAIKEKDSDVITHRVVIP